MSTQIPISEQVKVSLEATREADKQLQQLAKRVMELEDTSAAEVMGYVSIWNRQRSILDNLKDRLEQSAWVDFAEP